VIDTGHPCANKPPQHRENIAQAVFPFAWLFEDEEEVEGDGEYWGGDPEYYQLLAEGEAPPVDGGDADDNRPRYRHPPNIEREHIPHQKNLQLTIPSPTLPPHLSHNSILLTLSNLLTLSILLILSILLDLSGILLILLILNGILRQVPHLPLLLTIMILFFLYILPILIPQHPPEVNRHVIHRRQHKPANHNRRYGPDLPYPRRYHQQTIG